MSWRNTCLSRSEYMCYQFIKSNRRRYSLMIIIIKMMMTIIIIAKRIYIHLAIPFLCATDSVFSWAIVCFVAVCLSVPLVSHFLDALDVHAPGQKKFLRLFINHLNSIHFGSNFKLLTKHASPSTIHTLFIKHFENT